MTSRAFPIAALVLGHEADPSRTAALGVLVTTAAEVGASPIVVAIPPGIEVPPSARVVRTRASGPRIGAIRLGMAQLANSPARVVLLLPSGATPSIVELLSLIDTSKQAPNAIVAFAGASLDESPVLVPRDAWLELVTVAENGLDAIAARRRVERIERPRR